MIHNGAQWIFLSKSKPMNLPASTNTILEYSDPVFTTIQLKVTLTGLLRSEIKLK